MRIDILKVLGLIAVILGLCLEAIMIIGLIKEGIMLENSKAIIGWSVGIVVFIPAIVCLFKLFISTLDD